MAGASSILEQWGQRQGRRGHLGPMFLCLLIQSLLSQSLQTVWQLWFHAVGLEAWSPHSVSAVPQDGPLQVRALSEATGSVQAP